MDVLKKIFISVPEYHKIINTDDFNTFEVSSVRWVKDVLENHDKNFNDFFKMMQNHEKCQVWFSSFIGFFYQHGIGCDINKNLALELFSIIVNNKIYK